MPKHKVTNHNVLYGGATYNVSGDAKFELEEIGIGSYEYWGSKEHDSLITVFFNDIKIDSIVLENQIEWGKQTLSDEDMAKIADIILDELNSDQDLRDEIAWEFSNKNEPND